jgi:hypothetical protein
MYEERSPLLAALLAITGAPPPDYLRGVKALGALSPEQLQHLQDWASYNARPDWATGESILDAAQLLVARAIENNNLEEHETD